MQIRSAKTADLDAIKAIEDISFPPNQRVSKEAFGEFLAKFADDIFVACENNQIIGEIVSLCTNERDFDDDMFFGTKFHDKDGAWLMGLSLGVVPKFSGRGVGSALIGTLQTHAQARAKSGIVLTCEECLVKFYEKFGFVNEGICKSKFGDKSWYQMRWEIKKG
ncbi:GNAT family N-acetyltransferase [Campylobacter sp. JMF_01 NE2]|uniref:GNAT family N-acetyltransferase n=1 Tax=unclassified Campylobacter TaxID=2593542 RepID=UPI0022E9B365|nr:MULTISPECIES: GNAT family N-acetyltransferase [unclassified Campylobacter]MDA3052028.1 GNAT family N-acetyltransferase [Campylobacter sp. JMF_03 NE3]MDA3066362.1 GNAT family N-acetyltransferase [Campylobacter sp. JMF_01 NE2]